MSLLITVRGFNVFKNRDNYLFFSCVNKVVNPFCFYDFEKHLAIALFFIAPGKDADRFFLICHAPFASLSVPSSNVLFQSLVQLSLFSRYPENFYSDNWQTHSVSETTIPDEL